MVRRGCDTSPREVPTRAYARWPGGSSGAGGSRRVGLRGWRGSRYDAHRHDANGQHPDRHDAHRHDAHRHDPDEHHVNRHDLDRVDTDHPDRHHHRPDEDSAGTAAKAATHHAARQAAAGDATLHRADCDAGDAGDAARRPARYDTRPGCCEGGDAGGEPRDADARGLRRRDAARIGRRCSRLGTSERGQPVRSRSHVPDQAASREDQGGGGNGEVDVPGQQSGEEEDRTRAEDGNARPRAPRGASSETWTCSSSSTPSEASLPPCTIRTRGENTAVRRIERSIAGSGRRSECRSFREHDLEGAAQVAGGERGGRSAGFVTQRRVRRIGRGCRGSRDSRPETRRTAPPSSQIVGVRGASEVGRWDGGSNGARGTPHVSIARSGT